MIVLCHNLTRISTLNTRYFSSSHRYYLKRSKVWDSTVCVIHLESDNLKKIFPFANRLTNLRLTDRPANLQVGQIGRTISTTPLFMHLTSHHYGVECFVFPNFPAIFRDNDYKDGTSCMMSFLSIELHILSLPARPWASIHSLPVLGHQFTPCPSLGINSLPAQPSPPPHIIPHQQEHTSAAAKATTRRRIHPKNSWHSNIHVHVDLTTVSPTPIPLTSTWWFT